MQDPKNSVSDALLQMLGDRFRVNYSTFLDEEIGFIYLSVPAVANFRTAGSLQMGIAHLQGAQISIEKPGQIFNRKLNIIDAPKDVGFDVFDHMLEDDSVIKFAFVRDPVERFATAYRNQLSINKKNSDNRHKVFEFLSISPEENLSMLDFAELLIEEDGLKDVLPLITPQRRLIAFDLLNYHFIGRHERWEEDYPRIAMEVFGCETPIFDPVKQLRVDPEGMNLFSLIDQETRSALQQAYKEDYDMLDEIDELFPDGFAIE